MADKKNSIYVQLLKLLIFAALISGIFGAISNSLAGLFIDSYYESHEESKNNGYITDLKQEIESRQMSTRDTQKLIDWVKRQRVISVQIYKDDILVFDSDYPNKDEIWEEGVKADYYEWASYYEVKFQDGTAYVLISGMYRYQVYMYMTISIILLSFLLFLGIVMAGIRRIIKYIQTLGKEIEILESGNLDYKITVYGKNELSALAEGLDDMRRSFKEHVEKEAHLVKANQKMITEMSHDLRTPLTSVMIYSDILNQGKYKNEQEMREYAEKINKKTHQMKRLTDNLFEYALISSETEIELDGEKDAEMIFYDPLSEMCGYLEQKGFFVDADLKWKEAGLRVYSEYISRIFDNIASNIVKYADISEKVAINIKYDNNCIKLSFKNTYIQSEKKSESTNIGIENIKNMMKQMRGTCEIDDRDNIFNIKLTFPSKLKEGENVDR
ncbi:MAG: HAMP domain-containing histidine kinase [Firmicutes bacterium]|nr:HAMP domain-containing histidine kinase [Bacillota bacterium]